MKMTFDIQVGETTCEINGKSYPLSHKDAIFSISHVLEEYLFDVSKSLHGTFNRNVYWTDEVEFAVQYALRKKYVIRYTKHLLDRLRENKLPRNCYKAMLYGEIVEAEFDHGEVVKVVTRLPNHRNPDTDICAAIQISGLGNEHIATVRTVWLNRRDDMHDTINEENYVRKI